MLSPDRDLDAARGALTTWLARMLPRARDVSLSPLRKPGAGVSNETLLFDATWTQDGRPHDGRFVARLEPAEFYVFPRYDLALQVRVMRALAGTGVPVPTVRWFEEDAGVLGCPFYVMDRLDGEVPTDIPPYHVMGFLHDAPVAERARLWNQAVDVMARIHAVDWRARELDFLGVPDGGTAPLDRQLDYWAGFLEWARGGKPQPVLDASLAWLRANRYTPRRTALCWGDSRLGNLMYRDGRLVAVFDWEMAFLGDPEADLGWFLFLDWTFCEGYGLPRLEGLPDAEATRRRYESVTGVPVEHARWNEVFAAFRYGVIMARVAGRLIEIGAPVPAPDYASNNVCTQRLAQLLDLDPPGGGAPRAMRRTEELAVTVQFRLTGAGARAWYVKVAAGDGTRHEGEAGAADLTLTCAAVDWDAMQRGELERTQAFLKGKLKIDGDATVMLQLEEVLARVNAGA